MILIYHLLVGAAIASKIQFIPLALILAFLSHYFLDVLPQKDYSVANIVSGQWNKAFPDFLKVFLDIAFGLLLIFLLSKNTLLIFAGAFVAVIPDGFTLLHVIFNENKLLRKHREFHRVLNIFGENEKIPLWGKLLFQFSMALIAIFFLLQ